MSDGITFQGVSVNEAFCKITGFDLLPKNSDEGDAVNPNNSNQKPETKKNTGNQIRPRQGQPVIIAETEGKDENLKILGWRVLPVSAIMWKMIEKNGQHAINSVECMGWTPKKQFPLLSNDLLKYAVEKAYEEVIQDWYKELMMGVDRYLIKIKEAGLEQKEHAKSVLPPL